MKRFAIRMPNTRKTEVRIVGSSGAALDRAAHPVLGARFSRPAALAKVAMFKKGDASCSVQSTYHQGAAPDFHIDVCELVRSAATVAGESHHRVAVRALGEKTEGQRISLPAKKSEIWIAK